MEENYLLRCLRESKDDIHANSFTKYVWFQFTEGRFLYFDKEVKYELVKPLIESKQLFFVKIDNHQGEKMAKYDLIENYGVQVSEMYKNMIDTFNIKESLKKL